MATDHGRQASPKVTVSIPVYNRAKYVGAAIESILTQSFSDFELLLIDDGSTDDSVEVVNRYADPRIRLVHNDGNKGIPYTRNRALELARGEYIALLDSDDIAAPRRLERQVAFLDRHRDIATLGGWVRRFNASKRSSRLLMKPLVPEQLKAWLLFRCSHANSSLMARTAVLREYGYRNTFNVSEDFDLLARISLKYRSANLPNVLTLMRDHDERITNERKNLVKDTKLKIAAQQLDTLGVNFDQTDLDRHFQLMRMKRLDIKPDGAFVEWSGEWLERLQAANREAGIYSDPALSAVLGAVWAYSCWQAMPAIGSIRVLRYFRQSPLRTSIWSSLADNLAFAVRQSSSKNLRLSAQEVQAAF